LEIRCLDICTYLYIINEAKYVAHTRVQYCFIYYNEHHFEMNSNNPDTQNVGGEG